MCFLLEAPAEDDTRHPFLGAPVGIHTKTGGFCITSYAPLSAFRLVDQIELFAPLSCIDRLIASLQFDACSVLRRYVTKEPEFTVTLSKVVSRYKTHRCLPSCLSQSRFFVFSLRRLGRIGR